MTASKRTICAVALLIAPVLGACGSGGDDGRLTGAKGAWAAQVDPICAELQGQIGELGQEPDKQAAAIEAAVLRIKSTPYPREDDQRAALYIAAMENLYLSLQDVHQARLVNDQPRAQRALEGAVANNDTAAAAAKSYGLVECAQKL